MIIDFGLPANASPQEVYDECWKGVQSVFQIADAALREIGVQHDRDSDQVKDRFQYSFPSCCFMISASGPFDEIFLMEYTVQRMEPVLDLFAEGLRVSEGNAGPRGPASRG